MTDVFAVQDEIAAAVVAELKIKLLGAAPKSRETDPRPMRCSCRLAILHRQGTADAYRQAIALYQRAVGVDPTHVAAWVGLAYTYWWEAYGGGRPADDGIGLARKAVERALALDSEYAPAHSLLGLIAIGYDLDYAAGAQHIERALALEPANPDIIGAAGYLARRLGRLEQAIALFEYEVAHDPLNWVGHDDLAFSNRYAGHLDKAIAGFRTVLSLAPSSTAEHSLIGEVFLQKGDAKAALAEVKLEPDEQSRLLGLSMVYHALGRTSESDAALAELIRKYEQDFYFRNCQCAGIPRRD